MFDDGSRATTRRLFFLLFLLLAFHTSGYAISAVSLPSPPGLLSVTANDTYARILPRAADTLGPTAPMTRGELRELRRMEKVDERIARRQARRGPGRAPIKLHETAGGLDVASFALALVGLGLFALSIAIGINVPAVLLILMITCFPLAAIFGTIARRRIRYGARGNRGLALAGGIIGWVFSVAFLAGLVASLLFRMV